MLLRPKPPRRVVLVPEMQEGKPQYHLWRTIDRIDEGYPIYRTICGKRFLLDVRHVPEVIFRAMPPCGMCRIAMGPMWEPAR